MGMLDGKVVFISGGASGIGKGTALRFAHEGAKVAIADVQPDESGPARAGIEAAGARTLFFALDVSDLEAVRSAVDGTVEKFGRLDIVVANAGTNGVWAPLEELEPEEWDKALAINLKGTSLTTRYAVPHLKRGGGGSVIITSSVNGNRTFSNPGASAYSSSKASPVAFMKMAALDLGRHGIRVNAVCPGTIHTQIE